MIVPMAESESTNRVEECFDQPGVSALNIYKNEESKRIFRKWENFIKLNSVNFLLNLLNF